MFYLLAVGGTGRNDPPLNHDYLVDGIGVIEAAKIAFQTMLARLSPSPTYPDMRDAWIAAAEDLYGPDAKQVRSVKDAWYAVGIGEPASDRSHSPADGEESVAPWPATLEWENQAEEFEWEAQISTSPDFDKTGIFLVLQYLTRNSPFGPRMSYF